MQEQEFENLVREHIGAVYRFSYGFVRDKPDAEDITQEAFVKAWRNLRKFDPQKNFRNWIFEIAKNTALDFIKKKKTVPLPDVLVDQADSPFELSANLEEAGVIRQAIQKLGPVYQEVVRFYDYDDYTFREIAEITGQSLNTIKSRYRRGIARLRSLLK